MDAYFLIDLFHRSLPLLLMGLMTTLQAFCCSLVLSGILGIVFGVFCCEELKIPYLSPCIQAGAFVLRAVPFYVQLLIVYFVLPDFIGVNLETFPAAVLALGCCSAGYVCQIVRCGINSIPKSQWESAYSLGYSKVGTLRYVVFPQMFRNVLPAFNNEAESLIKSTSILSAIGVLELTRIGMNIVSREMGYPLGIYLIVAVFYVGISLCINGIARGVERRMMRKVRA